MLVYGSANLATKSHYHALGTEYLAANPVRVPKLLDLLNECGERKCDAVFADTSTRNTTADVFDLLPPELQSMVLGHLLRRDVANLRLASRTFSQLPQSFFHSLIKRKMPWIWEIDTLGSRSIDWHKLWFKLSDADGGSLKDEKERRHREYTLRKAVDDAEENFVDIADPSGCLDIPLPEEHEGLARLKQRLDEEARAEFRQACAENPFVERKATEINGLRNRRRVWTDSERLLKRIQRKKRIGRGETMGTPDAVVYAVPRRRGG